MRHTSFSILALLVLGSLIRVIFSLDALWLDEIWSIRFAQTLDSPLGFLNSKTLDGHSSLYTSWIWIVRDYLSPLIFRGPSLISSIGLLLLAACIFPAGTREEKIFFVALLGISYPFVLLGTEARGYSPMMLCAAVSLSQVSNGSIVGLRGVRLYLFGTVSILGFLFHYSFVAVLAAISIQQLCRLTLTTSPRSTLYALISRLGPAWLMVGTLYFTHIRFLRSGLGPNRPVPEVLFSTLGLTFGSTSAIVGVAVAVILTLELFLERKEKRSDTELLLLAGVVLPLMIVFVINPQSVMERYFYSTSWCALVFASRFLERLSRLPKYGVLAIVAFGVIAAANLYLYRLPRNPLPLALDIMREESTNVVKVCGDSSFELAMLIGWDGKGVASFQPECSVSNGALWYIGTAPPFGKSEFSNALNLSDGEELYIVKELDCSPLTWPNIAVYHAANVKHKD